MALLFLMDTRRVQAYFCRMPDKKKEPWDQYSTYLHLDKILDAQKPWSDGAGKPAHDEMIFIIFHQVYELWFKQILFELDDVCARMSGKTMDDRDLLPVLKHLDRIVSIMRVLVKQLDVLETMTNQDFTDFREHLKTASGFQSWQFRLIETRLGLRREDRLQVFHGQFDDNLCPASRKAIQDTEQTTSLFDLVDRWLSRTPFIEKSGYKFWESYREAVYKILDEKKKAANDNLTSEALQTELAAIEKNRKKFDGIFDPEEHKKGHWRMSWRALQAGLFITVYRNEPALQIPFRLLSLIMDIDELFALWRYRHALMTQRMVGFSMGTGGSAGYGYLMQTLEKHRIFTDLFGLSTYLIPQRALPPLPAEISGEMGYSYAKQG